MALEYPRCAYPFSTYLWMDPGCPEVQNRTYSVAVDLVTRYDLAGLHMDDYFYPYPVSGITFPDRWLYDEYVASGGTMSLDDWRRDNVNTLVGRLNNGLHAVKPWIKFSISPFGIYRPGRFPFWRMSCRMRKKRLNPILKFSERTSGRNATSNCRA